MSVLKCTTVLYKTQQCMYQLVYAASPFPPRFFPSSPNHYPTSPTLDYLLPFHIIIATFSSDYLLPRLNLSFEHVLFRYILINFVSISFGWNLSLEFVFCRPQIPFALPLIVPWKIQIWVSRWNFVDSVTRQIYLIYQLYSNLYK